MASAQGETWLVKQCHDLLVRFEADDPSQLERNENVLQVVPATIRNQLGRLSPIGKRSMSALHAGWQGDVLMLRGGHAGSLVLLCFDEFPLVRGLNSRFELLPTASGGWSLAASTSGKQTFVLAATCTDQQLMQSLLRPAIT